MAITSPGRSVVNDERNSIVRGMSKIICEVRADCMTSPLSAGGELNVGHVDLVGRDQLGADRHRPVEVLARRSTGSPPAATRARCRPCTTDEARDRRERVVGRDVAAAAADHDAELALVVEARRSAPA